MRLQLVAVLMCLIPPLCALAKDPPLPKGERLRDIVATTYPVGNVFIGSACQYRLLGSDTETVLDREFSYVTPANDFKQSAIHPSPSIWNWEQSDAWIRHCAEHGQVMRLHSPISPQCSKWAKDDSRTPEELRRNLEEYMTALCKRYNGKAHVKWMDVVNEIVSANGDWFGPMSGTDKWENPWPKIGTDTSHPLAPPLYIELAFRIANQHAPDVKQIINQHGALEDPAWEKIEKTVTYLRNKGLRVDGIGWQAHVDVGWENQPHNLDKLRALIAWAHANKLEFHVTENNVWLKKDKDWKDQAATFKVIVQVLLEKRDSGVVTWNLWHIRDSECWRPNWSGCMFFEDYTPKPAYFALQELLAEPPATEGKAN